uniref:Uncharacterized protein n=1 Tax=Chromera velia CCMP2878 TaxID=1169474 RepID=A0A0G4H2R3_9ALVE|eukprot:Cvel_24427.t1-p1 / transcript=Cvel_24427.t1 / gene=Cvel_24427 / organism=Chromera_velia_CCMP2878 / gene_product=hypothetical protein / transcript_product=hypothetical protein / location=Cvel_scaffold2639:3584-10511(-) / protein_length=635 / sequence_SO=supercontig / SO=protein_coding / is_pseudo=false
MTLQPNTAKKEGPTYSGAFGHDSQVNYFKADPTATQYHVNRDAYGLFCFCDVKDTEEMNNPFARSRWLVQCFCVIAVSVQVLAMIAVAPGVFNLQQDAEQHQEFNAAQGGILAYLPFSNIPMHALALAEEISASSGLMTLVDAIAVAVFACRMVPEINGHLRCLIVGLAQGSEKDPSRPGASALVAPESSFPLPAQNSLTEIKGSRWARWKWRAKRVFLHIFLGFLGCLVIPVSLLLTGSTIILQSHKIGDTLLNSIKSIFIADIDNYLINFLLNFAPVSAFKLKGKEDTELNKKEFQFRVPLKELEAMDVKGQVFRYQMTLYPIVFGFGLVPWVLFALKRIDSELPDINFFWEIAEERQTRTTVEFGCAFFSILLGSICFAAAIQLLFVVWMYGLESFETRVWRLHMIREFYDLMVRKGDEEDELRKKVDAVRDAVKDDPDVNRTFKELETFVPSETLTRRACLSCCKLYRADEEDEEDLLRQLQEQEQGGEPEVDTARLQRNLQDLVHFYTDNYISAFMRFLADPFLSIPLMLIYGGVNVAFFVCVVVNKHHDAIAQHRNNEHTAELDHSSLHVSVICIGLLLFFCNGFVVVFAYLDKTKQMISPRIDKHFIVLLHLLGTVANLVSVVAAFFD